MSGFQIVNGLAGLLIVTSLLVITARRPTGSAIYYALQSLVLVAIFLTLGTSVGSHELTAWAATSFVTKVLLVPILMTRLMGRLEDTRLGSGERIAPAVSVLLAAVVVVLCYWVVDGVSLPAAAAIKPALAVDRKSTRLNSSHIPLSRMPSSA